MTVNDRQQDRGRFLSFRFKLFTVFIAFVTTIFLISTIWYALFTYNQVFGQISGKLADTVQGALHGMDVENFVLLYQDEVQYNPDCPPRPDSGINGYYPQSNPRYQAHEAWLRAVQKISPDTRIYTYVKGPGPGDIIAIGSTGFFRQPRGGFKFCELYNSNGKTKIYEGLSGRVDQWSVYTDVYGSWITTYQPVTDASGKIVGAIGVDVSADHIQDVRTQVLGNILIVFFVITILSIIFVFWVSTFFSKPLSQLADIACKIGVGDYSQKLPEMKEGYIFQDETHILRNALESMLQGILARSEQLVESNRQLRELTRSVIDVQEGERRSVSRELHDEAGQALVSLKYNLEAALSSVAQEDTRLGQRLHEAICQVDETMEKIRLLAHRLRPPLLDITDLGMTLEQLCQDFSEGSGIRVDYQSLEIPPSLPDEISLTLFRFLQESLTNIAKHADARNVEVRLAYQQGMLSLLVSDDGKGQQVLDGKHPGMGHLGMRERLNLLGGLLEIKNIPGRGFSICASVPWMAEEHRGDVQ